MAETAICPISSWPNCAIGRTSARITIVKSFAANAARPDSRPLTQVSDSVVSIALTPFTPRTMAPDNAIAKSEPRAITRSAPPATRIGSTLSFDSALAEAAPESAAIRLVQSFRLTSRDS